MSATRLLLLGVVRIFGSAHGYLVHNELTTWGADEWANVKWGSIYHGLRQMTKKGLLEAHEADDHPWRVDYSITDAGDEEFFRLLRAALATPETRPDSLAAGVAFLTALSREEVTALLRQRLETLERGRESLRPLLDPDSRCEWEAEGAGHVPELFGLWAHTADSAIEWTKGLLGRIESGMYTMADDSPRAFGSKGTARPSPPVQSGG